MLQDALSSEEYDFELDWEMAEDDGSELRFG